MRLSRLLVRTLRQAPAEAETTNHQLLLRAGLIHQVAAGVYTYLPPAWRALRKIEAIIRAEMDAAGGQEVMMPVLQPQELWEESGRWAAFGPELIKLVDRRQRSFCLGPTHEEIATDLVRHRIRSYRDLPVILYQIQTKFRDEPRPRGGLMRAREFIMKDAYSFDADIDGLDASYQRMLAAYQSIFGRCGLATVAVEADSGAIGGKDSREFMVLAETGDNEVLICGECGYAANQERAEARKLTLPDEPLRPVEEIATPGRKTIADLATFLGIPRQRTLKAVFYHCDGQMIFCVVRGDFEVNEVKLSNALRREWGLGPNLRVAAPEDVAAAGLVAGSASPVGLHGVKVVADDSITTGANFVVGANRPDYHLLNVNYPRDFSVDIITDLALAQKGDQCARCGGVLGAARGIEVGHIFKLGTAYSVKMQSSFLDRENASRPLIMGCYGIGLGRLLAAAVEQNHDDRGIIWPLPIAPYQVHICALDMEAPDVAAVAETVYMRLEQSGYEVLYDDRAEPPGVKFADADLLGMPLRLTVSPRTLAKNSVELKLRKGHELHLVPLAAVPAEVRVVLAGA
jgi:prolyl-tRNA synthetase